MKTTLTKNQFNTYTTEVARLFSCTTSSLAGFAFTTCITSPEGWGFEISYLQAEHCFQVSGIWPRHGNTVWGPWQLHGIASKQVRFSAEKSPIKAFAEIRRRFLPSYLAAFSVLRDALKQHLDAEVNQGSVLARLAKASRGMLASDTGNPGEAPTRVRIAHGDLYGNFEPNHNGTSVRLSIGGLTVEQATRIAEILSK